jgi:hypothetical protein
LQNVSKWAGQSGDRFDTFGGGGQDFPDTEWRFENLGFSNADRTADASFKVVGTSLFVDLDNNNSMGRNGGFEHEITIVNVASGALNDTSFLCGSL